MHEPARVGRRLVNVHSWPSLVINTAPRPASLLRTVWRLAIGVHLGQLARLPRGTVTVSPWQVDHSRLHLGCPSAAPRLPLGCLSAASRLPLYCLSATSRRPEHALLVGVVDQPQPLPRQQVEHLPRRGADALKTFRATSPLRVALPLAAGAG